MVNSCMVVYLIKSSILNTILEHIFSLLNVFNFKSIYWLKSKIFKLLGMSNLIIQSNDFTVAQ